MDKYRNDYRQAQVSTTHVFLALSDERASSNKQPHNPALGF